MTQVIEINEDTDLDEALKPIAIWRFALEIRNEKDFIYYVKRLQKNFGFNKEEAVKALIKQLKENYGKEKEVVKA